MLLAKKNFKFHAEVQKCHFGKNEKLHQTFPSPVFLVLQQVELQKKIKKVSHAGKNNRFLLDLIQLMSKLNVYINHSSYCS